MQFCTKCGAPVNEDEVFCSNCGAPIEKINTEAAPDPQPVAPQPQAPVQYQPQYVPVQPVFVKDPHDHTDEFSAEDISNNKIIAMCPYLLGVLGIIIALLAANNSAYAGFHVRQALKFVISEVLLGIITVLLCWTIIVPIVAGICILVLLVCEIICFFNVCSGKAKDAPIVGNLPFFK